MKNLHEGIVIKTEPGRAKIKMNRHSHCESCGSCPGANAMIYDIQDNLGVRQGAKILLYIPEKNMLKAAFVMFVLPMLITFFFVFMGILIAPVVGIAPYYAGLFLGAIGIVLGFVNVYRFEKKQAKRNTIFIHSTRD